LVRVVVFLLVLVGAVAAYFAVVLNWNFSSGERAGWVQKFSNKGWICKTWEGEMAMVTMPGAVPEKFPFTVRDDAVAAQINKVMGKRVTLHYDEKVGLPTSCWGETRHFVTGRGPGRRHSAGARDHHAAEHPTGRAGRAGATCRACCAGPRRPPRLPRQVVGSPCCRRTEAACDAPGLVRASHTAGAVAFLQVRRVGLLATCRLHVQQPVEETPC
jgi:hypothetical protein